MTQHSPRRCPRCGTQTIKRSKRSPLDRLFSLFGAWPYRCGSCQHRWHDVRRSEPSAARPTKRERAESRQRRRAAGMRLAMGYLGALGIFGILVWFLTRPPA